VAAEALLIGLVAGARRDADTESLMFLRKDAACCCAREGQEKMRRGKMGTHTKKWQRLVLAFFAASLTVLVAGCGDDSDTKEDGALPSTTSSLIAYRMGDFLIVETENEKIKEQLLADNTASALVRDVKTEKVLRDEKEIALLLTLKLSDLSGVVGTPAQLVQSYAQGIAERDGVSLQETLMGERVVYRVESRNTVHLLLADPFENIAWFVSNKPGAVLELIELLWEGVDAANADAETAGKEKTDSGSQSKK